MNQPSNEFERLCNEQEQLYRAEFEEVFAVLFTDKHQRALYNTNMWDIGDNLPAQPDRDKIAEALKVAGFAGDERFCKDFTRYCEIVIEGKRLQQIGLTERVAADKASHQYKEGEGWRFMKITVFAPQEMQEFIQARIDEQAIKGEGLWWNKTEANNDDEALDDYMCVEAFNVQCSNQPFYSDLKRYGIVPALLNKDNTLSLFKLLKQMGDEIKNNTDKPNTVKNKIIERLRVLDDVPIWGLLFQILILQGLSKMLECCTLTEADNGYQDAVLLYEWLQYQLANKLMIFTFKPWGERDKKELKPLTDYMITTDVGRAVQKVAFGHTEAIELPTELATAEARRYFARAIKLGYMKTTPTGAKWLKKPAMLGYFCKKVFEQPRPIAAIEQYFDIRNLAASITQADYDPKRGDVKKWRAEIDSKIFYD